MDRVHLHETIKVSLLTNLTSSPPVFISMRRGGRANDGYDFLTFIVDCVVNGHLVAGDTLIMDNARIHTARYILSAFSVLMHAAQVQVWFLPTYSPELNPCEPVFGQCKHYLRYRRCMHAPFWSEVVVGFSKASAAHMLNYYNKCIWDP